MSETHIQTVRHWLKARLTRIVNVQNCLLPIDSDHLIVNTWTGVIINVYLIHEPQKTRAIKRILQEGTQIGIGSLFILDADLLPQPDTRFEPQEWLLALHALHHERLYAYDIDAQGPKLIQVHLEPIGTNGYYVTKYGPPVQFDQLRYLKVSIKPRYLKGDWQIADFGLHAFWRNPYNPHHTTYTRPPNRQYQWAEWSQTTWNQSKKQEMPPPPPQPAKSQLEQSYALLEIEIDADREEVKAAFRKLALTLHPDTSTLPKAEAEAKFRALSEAYEYIKTYRKW